MMDPGLRRGDTERVASAVQNTRSRNPIPLTPHPCDSPARPLRRSEIMTSGWCRGGRWVVVAPPGPKLLPERSFLRV